MTDSERRLWILNDEGLYNWFRSEQKHIDPESMSSLNMKEFIKKYKTEIDAIIDNVLEGRKPAHYLAYGGKR